MNNFPISPLEDTRLPQAVAAFTPEVTWRVSADNVDPMFTVIVWDAGYGYLNGLYVNADNSLSSGEVGPNDIIQLYFLDRF